MLYNPADPLLGIIHKWTKMYVYQKKSVHKGSKKYYPRDKNKYLATEKWINNM